MRQRNIVLLLFILLLLGGYFYINSLPILPPKDDPQLFVWLIEIEDIQHISIQLPRSGEGQAFIKEADRTWHFDNAQRTPVDMQRWGGGIPLLLSGPGTDRVLYQETSEEKLAEFGLTNPLMEITLTLVNDEIMVIKVGDNTPNTTNHYVQAPDSTAVALVDYTWYDVISSLVTDPPYISDDEAQ